MYTLALLIIMSSNAQLMRAKIFNPIDYGAKGDGISDDTSAIRATVAAVAANKGGEMFVDERYVFLTGGFNITNNIIMNVKGKIMGSLDSSNYIPMRGKLQWQPLIQANGQANITITGGGIIDGQGAPWWYCFHRENASLHLHGPPCNGLDRPNLIWLTQCKNISIYDITLVNSPFLNAHLHGCVNVHMHHITVLAASNSPNTDGFDIDCSVNVLLEDSYYSGGDDAVAVACDGGFNDLTTENVLVRNMTVGTSHGLSIGSGTSSGVRNVTFEHSIGIDQFWFSLYSKPEVVKQNMGKGMVNSFYVNGSDNGIRIKSQRGNGGFVRDVTYSNIQLYSVKNAIVITLNYNQNLPPKNATYTPQIANININNIYSDGAQTGWFLDGLPESYIGKLFFTKVTMMNTAQLFGKCDFAYGSCTSVLPSCPSCLQ